MLENDTKGWHGSFSAAGRNSAEKYHMIVHKDSIIAGKGRKKKVFGFFQDDDENGSNQNDLNDDHVDIFNLPFNTAEEKEKERKLKKQKKILCKGQYSKENVNERFKYHQHHHKDNSDYIEKLKGQKGFQPSCTRYNPKMDFIWNKTLTGPSWKLVKGREENVKLPDNTNEFYLTHSELKPLGKIFINMDKQTERGDFSSLKDVRMRSDKPFKTEANKKINKNKSVSYSNNNSGNAIGYTYTFSKNNMTSSKNSERGNNDQELFTNQGTNGISTYENTYPVNGTNYNNISVNQIKGAKSFQTSRKNLNKIYYNTTGSIYPTVNHGNSTNKIKAPDFSKTISREQLNFISRDKSPISPFITPNFSAVQPRNLTMVSYTNSLKKTKKPISMPTLNANFTYNPDKVLNKINNHKEPKAPNFASMVSRPNENTPLPSYMIKKFDRSSIYTTTDKTLELNNFANGKFLTEYSSFYPKKSFNKAINLNLLNNEKFVESNLDLVGAIGKTNKIMEFYSKNLDDITNDGVGSKFDSVTFKTVPKISVMSEKEKEIFKVNFTEEDD